MFGFLGWGFFMFFVGFVLDYLFIFLNYFCMYIYVIEKNYMICFVVFLVLMSCVFVIVI